MGKKYSGLPDQSPSNYFISFSLNIFSKLLTQYFSLLFLANNFESGILYHVHISEI